MATVPSAGSQLKVTDTFDDRTWTPVWAGGVTSLGSGATNEGRWTQIGNRVEWQFRTQFGTGVSFSATLQLTLPVQGWAGGGSSLQMATGHWLYRQSSVPAHHAGTVAIFDAGGTTVSFGGAWDGSQPRTRINATQPFAPSAGDVLSASGIYYLS